MTAIYQVSRPEHLQSLSCQVLREINRQRVFRLEITGIKSFDLDPDLLQVDEHREIIFDALQRNDSLLELTSYNGITSTHVCRSISSLLKVHPTISTLLFEFRQLESIGADWIIEGLCYNTKITSLDMCYGGLDNLRVNYARVIDGLSSNRSLTKLRLEISNSLEVRALGNLIQSHGHLRHIEITLIGDAMHNEDWITFATSLQSKPALELSIHCHPKRCVRRNMAMSELLMPLKQCLQFKSFTMVLGTITDDNWRAISQFLFENAYLKDFRASGMNLDLGYRVDLTLALTSTRRLESLNLSLCSMSTDSCIALGDVIKSSKSITSLNLTNCNIGKDNVQFITQALMTDTTIKTIVLNGNNLQNEGCREIAKLLSNNTTLTSLAIQMNNYSNGGLQAICNSVKANQFLQRLSFGTPMAMLDGFKSIRDMLQTNNTLEHLDISDCRCVRDIAKLVEGLKNNKSITSLTMHMKIHYDEVRSMFEELFEVNRTIITLRLSMHNGYRGPNTGEVEAFEAKNKDYQQLMSADLSVLVHNIKRSIMKQSTLVPWEIWHQILSQTELPGIRRIADFL